MFPWRTRKVSFDKIFVLGAGGIGSICGALLSKKNNVTLIGNKTHVKAVNLRGLRVSGDIIENFRLNADTKIHEIPKKTLIILATKAHDSERAVRGIKRLLQKDIVILVLQNGLGNTEVVRKVVGGKTTILRGITTMATEFLKPGRIRFWNGETIIERNDIAEKVAKTFNACKLKTRLSSRMNSEIWNKLVTNCVINPITALLQVRNQEIAADTIRPVIHEVIKECVQVGKAEGITFQHDIEEKIRKEIKNYANLSSMCQDIIKGKKTEIDFLNGRIVELGKKNSIPTPVNETLVSLIKFMEEKNGLSRKNQTGKK
jgi:2-dehydropantoate 2-reductase